MLLDGCGELFRGDFIFQLFTLLTCFNVHIFVDEILMGVILPKISISLKISEITKTSLNGQYGEIISEWLGSCS